jgi:hypothetical protein
MPGSGLPGRQKAKQRHRHGPDNKAHRGDGQGHSLNPERIGTQAEEDIQQPQPEKRNVSKTHEPPLERPIASEPVRPVKKDAHNRAR